MLVFYSSMFQLECCLNSFALIPFLSYSNRSAFIIYLIPSASCHSTLLLECSRFFASSFEFLFHLIPFPFRLGPKISGRDLLLVEKCCNAPDPMREVSASYSSLLPCHFMRVAFCHVIMCISFCIRVRLMHPSIFPVIRFAIQHSYVLPRPPFCLSF